MHLSQPAPDASTTNENGFVPELSADEAAIIFGFLSYTDIMRARVLCTSWREAAEKTIVPPTELVVVRSVRSYNAMRVMSTALPNLSKLMIRHLDPEQRYTNGVDPDEERAAATANYTTHDINIVSNFRKLRELSICKAPLNGRYPVLFNFPLLRVLRIHEADYLKFDLEMLGEGLPSLEELYCARTSRLTGNVNSLRALRDTLEKVDIVGSDNGNICGNFMDLADFPRLRELHLYATTVTGDIRDISGSDFPALKDIFLPKTAAGGKGFEFQTISEVPSFMQAIHLLMRRKIMPLDWTWPVSQAFRWRLSRDSSDWYESLWSRTCPAPPFSVQIIQAGNRLGWSWCSHNGDHSCEINWLDPVPSTVSGCDSESESDDYESYLDELQHIQQCYSEFEFYRGYHQPPNEQQYRRLREDFEARG